MLGEAGIQLQRLCFQAGLGRRPDSAVPGPERAERDPGGAGAEAVPAAELGQAAEGHGEEAEPAQSEQVRSFSSRIFETRSLEMTTSRVSHADFVGEKKIS